MSLKNRLLLWYSHQAQLDAEDSASPSEIFSYIITSIIRRWIFVALYTVFSILWWAGAFGVALSLWNVWASYMALVIESSVGIAVYYWMRRDSSRIRKILIRQEEMHAQKLRNDMEIMSTQKLILKHLEEKEPEKRVVVGINDDSPKGVATKKRKGE